jgi:hypothetical protein
VRARQVARPDRPSPFRGLDVPQDFEGLPEFFRGSGHRRRPLGSCLYYLIALRSIYTIALYYYYPITLYYCYFIMSREDWSRPPGSAAPHPVADKLISLFSISEIVKIARNAIFGP